MGVKGYAIHLSFSPGNGVLMRDNTPKSTRTQGGDPIADYIRADTRLPAYLPYPRFLLKMEISQTAKLLYSLLLDRSTLSQKNKWLDDEGRIYIIYPIAEIAEILDKGSTTIKGALNELDTAGLLERERGGFSAPVSYTHIDVYKRQALHRGYIGSAPDCGDRRCPPLSQQAGSHRIRRHRCVAVPVRQILRE